MKTDEMEKMLSCIPQQYLDQVLQKRAWPESRTESREQRTRHRRSIKVLLISAACMILGIGAVAGFVYGRKAGILFPSTVMGETGTDTSKHTGERGGTPEYIQAYCLPTLEEVYSMEPYSELIPRDIPSEWQMSGSYMILNDPIANPSGSKFLALDFSTGPEPIYHFSVQVSDYRETEHFADLTNPDSYTVSNFYEKTDPEVTQKYSVLFRAEDVSEKLMPNLIMHTADGRWRACIRIFWQGNVLGLDYHSDKEISASEFYRIIRSAEFLQEGEKK